ncbi:MAG TPA: ATP-binding cassette domain-containing protein [Gemmatimonadaceae bacterium]|nr:ATP-binding cassette domain-containing protein [Gemmatimonadaceae bacterium]
MTAPGRPGAAITIDGLQFAYGTGSRVLDIPSLTIERGARVFLHGPSGCGKTTLLGILAGVLQARQGRVRVLDHDLVAMSGAARDAFRAQHIGYVFQQFNLIPYLSAYDNIALPCRLDARRRARLGTVGIDEAIHDIAVQLDIVPLLQQQSTALSVGQQQRVAAARALLGAPDLVICDEPTSSLDTDRRDAFLALLAESVRRAHATLLFVSHDASLGARFDVQLSLPALNRAARMDAA